MTFLISCFGLKTLKVSCLLNALPKSLTTVAVRDISTSTSRPHKKIHELRQYVLKPNGIGMYKSLTSDLFHLRTQHSKLVGFWFSEMGTHLNKSIHIWEYDSLTHREEVRAKLAKDEEWQSKYVENVFPFLQEQQNCSMSMPAWCNEVNPSKKKAGVYELMTYTMVMGGPAVWDRKLKSSIDAHVRLGYSELIGVWYTDIGNHNTVQVLWRYDNYNKREEGRELAHNDAVVVNKVRDNLNNVIQHSSVIMLPSAWSPMQ